MRLVTVDDAVLEAEVSGSDEPVVLIQTALTADELRPLAEQQPLREGYRTILYHRRGYAGSSRVVGPRSVADDAADCRSLLAALNVGPAHVVGVSYSAAVALHLAAWAPEWVHSLTVLEPPPVHVRSAPEFRAATARLVEIFRARGAAVALEEFMTTLIGPYWRSDSERMLPGSVAQMERDARTFFATDVPALLAWEFGVIDAAQIGCPVLYVGGTDSGTWFAEVRELILGMLPQADAIVVDGAGHSLAMTHPAEVAMAVVGFLQGHPLNTRR